ncbi:MAG: DUF1786 family protein [Candidatus Methanofastidiosia archaeon]
MILTLDVGKGTQDIVLYHKGVILKCVLPSPTKLLAEKISKIEDDLVIHGETMGGGPLAYAIKNHLKRHRVFMTKKAALTLADDLSRVQEMGVEIISEEEVSDLRGVKVETSDVDLKFYEFFLKKIGLSLDDVKAFGIALQDHGYSKESNRIYRFNLYERLLKEREYEISELYFEDIPKELTRARSAFSKLSFENKIFMDSSYAAVLGAWLTCGDCLALNLGNGHVLGALIEDGVLYGLFEHHTHLVKNHLETYVRKLLNGKIENKEIFESGGHGAFSREPKNLKIVAVGPKKELLKDTKLDFEYIYPLGDEMLPGNFALIYILKDKLLFE